MRIKHYVLCIIACLPICIVGLFSYANVMAQDLLDRSQEVKEDIEDYYDIYEEDIDNGSLSFNEEDEQANDPVLFDTFRLLSSEENTRINIYDSDYEWLFRPIYFNIYYLSNVDALYIIPQSFHDEHLDLFNSFKNNLSPGSPLKESYITLSNYDSKPRAYTLSSVTLSTSQKTVIRSYLYSINFPFDWENEYYWSDEPEPTPDPDPTPTPDPDPTTTPDPDPTPTPEPTIQYLEYRPELSVVIFAFGCLIGCVAGLVITDFIK